MHGDLRMRMVPENLRAFGANRPVAKRRALRRARGNSDVFWSDVFWHALIIGTPWWASFQSRKSGARGAGCHGWTSAGQETRTTAGQEAGVTTSFPISRPRPQP